MSYADNEPLGPTDEPSPAAKVRREIKVLVTIPLDDWAEFDREAERLCRRAEDLIADAAVKHRRARAELAKLGRATNENRRPA